MRTSPTKLYQKLNKQFFSNRLPRYRVVLCNLRGFQHGECLPDRRPIRIDRSLDSGTMRSTLLHEICNIGPLGHRPRFQAKLMRLAKQGEE